MFNKGGAAFAPVAAIHVNHTVDFADVSVVYMTTYHALGAFASCVTSQTAFKIAYEIDCFLNFVFRPCAEAPIRQS